MKNLLAFPLRIGWRDHLVGAALAVLYVAWLILTARSLGFARDEGFYFHASSNYARWFMLFFEHPRDAISRGAVDSIWASNHEHPALMKSLFALSWMYLHTKWKIFSDASTAFRFPAMVMAGIAIWTTYLFGARAFSRRAGVVAACLFALMPRVFYNSHLACFDIPIATLWMLTIYVYWRSLEERGIGWAIAVGIVYGLTLQTKHNAWIMPFVVIPHAIFTERHAICRRLAVGRFSIPTSILSMAVLGPMVFFALWPWMWNDTFPRLQAYFNFHLHHEYYNMEFFGKNYFGPPSPRGYMPLMIVATVPSITLVLFFVGAFDRLFAAAGRLVAWVRGIAAKIRKEPPAGTSSLPPRDPRETDLLLALGFGAAIGPWLLAKTPIFGGTKHWHTAYPFLALLAGHGFDLAARATTRALEKRPETWRLAAQLGLGAAVLVPPLVLTAHSHPFGLTTYVPLVGGAAGAADIGLNRQFWGFTTASANAEYLEKAAPRGASVFIHDTAWDSWNRMVQESRVRSDLRGVGSPTESHFALVHHELHMAEIDHHIWVAYGSAAPAYVVRHDGVPVVSVYKRP